MKIRIISDIHLDFDKRTSKVQQAIKNGQPVLDLIWTPPVLEHDHETVLIIAGDLWYDNHAFKLMRGEEESWISNVSYRFLAVIIVLGNHDYWDGTLEHTVAKGKKLLKHLPNVHLLENESVTIKDVEFSGCTLWTDYNRGNPVVENTCRSMMNDYDCIRTGDSLRKTNPSDMKKVFYESVNFLKNLDSTKKRVIITHMLPSYSSIDEVYKDGHITTQYMNYAYYSDLDDVVEDSKAVCWIHGHTHIPKDYMIGETRVICNPRGYIGSEQTGWNPNLLIDVD